MAEAGDSDRVRIYRDHKKSLVAALIAEIGGPDRALRTIAPKVKEACEYYGYRSGINASALGHRKLTKWENENYILTETNAAYLACAFARYGSPPWPEDDPEGALALVWKWCIWGVPEVPKNATKAELERLANLPTRIVLQRIQSIRPEPAEEIEETAALLRAASIPAVVEYMRALADNLEERQKAPIEPDEMPCDEDCVLANYLRLAQLVGLPITDADREAVAEATDIPLQRVTRLLCGDPWAESEAARINAYVGSRSKFTLEGLAAAARHDANNDSKVLGAGR